VTSSSQLLITLRTGLTKVTDESSRKNTLSSLISFLMGPLESCSKLNKCRVKSQSTMLRLKSQSTMLRLNDAL